MSIKSRRIIALLLCLVLVFSSMPVAAFGMDESAAGQVTEQNESEAVVSPDDVSADIDEQTTTEDNPTADVDDPAVEDETPAVEDETPAVEDETPAVEDETPAVEDETPAVEDETPAVQDETPAVEDETPAVEDETPAVEEEIPAVEEIPVLGGAITEQYGIMLLNEAMLVSEATGTVYISISYDGQYVNGENGEPVAYVPVSLSDLQAINLADYDLTDYDYNGQLTALHLYIYTHENIMGKEWSEVEVQGSAGSIFFANGLFGFGDCNLQYYCNGEYPAVDGWGVTADRLVLNDGDFFDIAAYTSWAFYGDSVTGFHYFLDNEEITHEYTATAGEALTVTLGRSNYGMNQVYDYTVSYGDKLGAADGTVTTNADGQAEITFAEAGTYYLWVDGGKGNENPNDIVSSPGYAKVTVEAGAEVIPGTPVAVTDNVIDITDKAVYSRGSSMYAKATNIKVSGADVESANEDGTTVYIVLDGATAANAAVDVTFGTSLGRNCTMSGTTGSITLQDGKATLSMTLTGSYYNISSMSGSATYTLNFSLGAPPTEPPTRLQESDSAETYSGVAVDLDLKEYFENASAYYLVEGEELTPLAGSSYTFQTFEGGTHTLVFAASNTVGTCADYVTVTVAVTEIKSGAWLGIETSNGSVKYVLFKDAEGNEIDGLTASLDGTAINVNVPRGFAPDGKIIASFDLTQNGGLPFLTTSNAATGSSTAGSNKFTEKTTALSNGAAVFTFYLYNAEPKATSNVYTTYTVNYITANEAPVLADGQTAAASAAITADKSFTLDLDGIFADPNGDTITGWQVSINGADAVSAVVDENNVYTYQTNNAGEYTLVFTALDTYNAVSTATYTVTLTVSDSTETYGVTVNVPESITPTFCSTTAYKDGVDVPGGTLAATAGTAVDGLVPYTLTVPANYDTVSVRADGLGGMSFAAADGASVTLRQVQMSVADYDGKTAASTNTVTYGDYTAVAGDNGWLLVTGQEYTYKANPTDNTLAAASATETLQTGEGICTVPIVLGINNPLTITATTGAKVQLYNIDTSKYYAASEVKAKIVKDNGDGTTTYSFVGDTKASGSCFVYHVSMDGKIAKSGYLSWGQQNVTVTYTDEDKSDTYRLDDYSATGEGNSGVAEDSVLLNINGQNNLAMSVGDTKTLKAYRIWEIVKISYQNYILTPDFTYTILSGSDVVSLTEAESPSTADGDWMTLTALKEGVAVIEVTYSAMEVTGGSYDGAYGASDPARTGLVVVTVGGADTSVKFGIDCFASMGSSVYSESTPKAWDAEFDTLYFTGASGELKLSPAASSEITEVAVSNDKGSSWDILTAEDGVYTAKIVSGNNIIRVTTENGVAYQVVRGDQVTCATQIITDLNEDGIIDPGDTVRVTLNGLHTPIPKMAGNYNPGFAGNTDGYSQVHIVYTFDNETVTGPGVQYDFGVNANYIDVTIPEDYTDNTITLNDGYIGVGVIGLTTFADGGDSHRNIPDAGCGTRGTQTTFNTRSILPEVTINVAVETPDPATYTVTLPADTVGYTVAATEGSASPVTEGGSYSFTVDIAEGYEAGENFAVKANDVVLNAVEGVYTIENITADQTVAVVGVVEKVKEPTHPVTVTAPIGSTVSVGTLRSYYIYTFSDHIAAVEDKANGTVTYGFDVPSAGGNSFVRVQHPEGVTYWDYVSMSEGTEINITEDMLFMNDSKHNPDTIIRDLSEYEMDVADVYINANAKGYMPMTIGETHEFNVFRDWHAVEGISNAKTALPDVSYKVIDVDGNESDIVSIVPDENNSSVATMTANEEGTAIVLVTYDAMYSTLALRGSIGTDPAKPAFFSAIWPENTGVLVVTVGSDGSDIQTNMTLNGHALDAEHDVFYYLGTEGASYSFKPDSGSKVSVARAALTEDSLTYSGFTTDGVTVNEDGSVTVSGLTAGSHIIKVENDGTATYQVICAKQTTVTITDSDGEEITVDNPADPCETVTVQLGSIYNPVNKLSGVYNSNCGIVYSGEDNKTFNGGRGSGFGYYLFAADPEVHKVSVTLPEVWADDTYSLTGYFSIGGNGKSAGAHRDLSYATGLEMDPGAQATAALLGSLPQVDIPVNASERVAATEVILNKATLKLNIGGAEMLTATVAPEGSTDRMSWTSSAPGVATVSNDGLVTGVAAGEAVITATAGEVSASCTVTVSSQTAVDLVLTTEAAYENEVYAATMDFSEIVISGLVPSSTMTGVEVKDGKNVITDKDNTCTIALTPGDYESITITLKPLLGSAAQSATSRLTYSCGDTTSNALSTYTDFAYTTSVTPVWENNQATLEVKLILNNKTVRANYTINLVIEEGTVPEPATYTVTMPTEAVGYTVTATEGSASPVTEGGSYSFTVTIAEGYEAGESFAVKVNNEVLTAVDGIYTIENITADQTVTVDGVVEKEEETSLTWQEVMAKTQTYLTGQAEDKAPIVGSQNGEWLVLGLARNDVEADFFDAYYSNVVNYVKEKIDAETGRLHAHKSTDNSRIILALSALGKDVTDVGGYDLLQGLSDTDYVKKQGINGVVWALIALDSCDYEIPANADSATQVTREWLVDYILSKELEDGGWALSGQVPDDMTPMAVQALAPYYESDAEVKNAVDKALTVMATMSATPETYAQMIVALSALGIDCEADERFVTDGISVLDKMLTFALEDGSFQKGLSSGANQMSTEQAFYAMVAYSRFQQQKTSLYDMTDVSKEEGDTPNIEVENVTLNVSSASVEVGENVTITVVVSPSDATDKTVTWTSSDTGIATVDNGKVTGVSEGTVTITATAGAHSATCTVTVTEGKEDGGGSSGGSSSGLDFGLSKDEIEGYVYVSFEDKGKRKADELDSIDTKFQSPLGTIIGRTKVPFKADDTIASVTLRLLDAKGFDAYYDGDEYSGFYLEAIGGFTANGMKYDSFGEFDAGQDSGWMITWKDWFINKGASEFMVENGDTIRWQYTCQLGADIGDDYFEEEGTLSGGGSGGAAITSEDRATAKEVKELISAIGTVDENSAEAIKAARAAYEALTDAQKELVPNYDELKAAEKAYAELTGEDIAPAELPFSDTDGHWAEQAIEFAYDEGLMKGESETAFAPELATSRAMIAAILYRLEGSPAVDGNASFADVTDGAWFAEAVQWAEANSIVSGYANGNFGPNDAITREQLASILYRYAAYKGQKLNAAADLSKFADADGVSEWARTALEWANAEGLITGKTDNTIDAQGKATRAEVATILMRYIQVTAE